MITVMGYGIHNNIEFLDPLNGKKYSLVTYELLHLTIFVDLIHGVKEKARKLSVLIVIDVLYDVRTLIKQGRFA
jgi:hypothetical protein